MSYALGIDLGTTFTAAAVSRNGRVEIVGMGNHASSIPSAVLLREDGELLVGDAATRRGQQEPARLAREFKRRHGRPSQRSWRRPPICSTTRPLRGPELG